ncbi:hypothetical protein [Candidatus Mycoplasma haematohominis]|nr:hypothetical protein [Candidatus Mycoplasma haemohominis]
MPFALICKDEIRWGSKLMVMESKPNIPEFLGVYVLCFIHEGLWWEQRVKDAFKPGKTVEFIGGWGRFVEWSKMKGRFFVFSLVALI